VLRVLGVLGVLGVLVFDVLDKTAAVKVTASWGVDYMLLGKYDGGWQIVQILWQSPPRDSAGANAAEP
jgi:hypothetical protein